jgi:type IV pilus assembly protein PilB
MGEKVALRILDKSQAKLDIEKLGFDQRSLEEIRKASSKPHGMILICGPTGSGKTTTLYAALRQLISGRNLNIIAVQDPVEYDIPGIAQVEVDNAQKVTFGKALRSILRHDPDVIMIGEIRDRETADIAIQASLTGHLVLATLHTNSAAGAVTRLHDMGIDRYLTAATVRLCIAQRLVRRLCPHCRTFEALDGTRLRRLGRDPVADARHARPKGCIYCAGRGWRGRLGLFEMLPVDAAMADLIEAGEDERSLAAAARSAGSPALVDDALAKMASGATSFDEIVSAVGD